jgi:hypothetical protein
MIYKGSQIPSAMYVGTHQVWTSPLLYDNFNSGWAAFWSIATSGWTVGGVAQPNKDGPAFERWLDANPGILDVAISVDFKIPPVSGSFGGLIARYTNSTSYFSLRVTNAGVVALLQTVGGVTTVLADNLATITTGTYYRIGLTCNGTLATALVNGISVGTATIPGALTTTKVGLHACSGGSGGRPTFDNFIVSHL